MADFRFRICNELLDEEDENSTFIINFTPETFTKAKEKLKKFIKKTFPEFSLGTQEDWDNDNCENKYFWQWFDDCELCYSDEPEEFDERFERITGIIDEYGEAFDIYIEEIPENDLIGPLCKEIKL
jgi:hypothetical protein